MTPLNQTMLRVLETLQVLAGERGESDQRAVRWADLYSGASPINDIIGRAVADLPSVPPGVIDLINTTTSDLEAELTDLINNARLIAEGAAADAVQALFDAAKVQGEHNDLVADFVGNLKDRFIVVDERLAVRDFAIQDQAEVIATITDNLLWAITHIGETDSLIRDAGIYLDPDTGVVRISAVDAVGGRVNDVSIALDAVQASLNLKASVAYVDGLVSDALLDPSQIPIIGDIEIRLSQAEIDINGLDAAILLKADITELSGIDTRLSQAEINISAAEAAIALRVEVSEFSDVETRLTLAEVEIEALDGAAIRQSVSDVRNVTESVAQLEELTLGQLLKFYQDRQTFKADLAYAVQDMRALVSEDRVAIATIETALGAAIDQNTALIETEVSVRASETDAIAQSVFTLQTDVSGVVTSLTQNYYTRSQVDAAIVTVETRLGGQVGGTYGAIQDVLDLNISPTSALLSTFTGLQASIGAVQDLTTGDFQAVLRAADDVTAGAAVSVIDGPAGFGQTGTIIVTETNLARSLTGSTNGASVAIPASTVAALQGQVVRVDVLARRGASNPSVGFGVAYVASNGATSGVKEFSHPGDDRWRWHSFTFLRPTTAAANTDYVALFADNAKSSKDTEFARVLLRFAAVADDIPEIATLSGEITEVKGLDLDALDGTAFGTLLAQLEVDAGGTSARITDQSSALANLAGFSSAFRGITVEATGPGGTQIAGFRATTYANPDGTGAATLELLGDVIAQGSMATNRLVVGLGRNLLTNTQFAAGIDIGWTFWTGPAGTHKGQVSVRQRQPGENWSGKYFPVAEVFQDGAAQDGYADFTSTTGLIDGSETSGVAITAGAWLDASVRISAHRCALELRIVYYDHYGALLSYSPLLDSGSKGTGSVTASPSNWPIYHGIHQAPAAAAYAGLHIRKLPTTPGQSNSYLFIHEPQVAVTHEDASEPVPYAPQGSTLISGNQILTDAIVARHISVANLAAINITVVRADLEEAIIGAAQIEDASITNAKIKNAEIDVLKLAGRFVVSPDFAFTAVAPGGTDIMVSLTVTRRADFVARIECSFFSTGRSDTAYLRAILTRSAPGAATNLRSVAVEMQRFGQVTTFVVVDDSAIAGATTYRLRIFMEGSLDPGNQAPVWSDGSIQVDQYQQ